MGRENWEIDSAENIYTYEEITFIMLKKFLNKIAIVHVKSLEN